MKTTEDYTSEKKIFCLIISKKNAIQKMILKINISDQ